MDRSRPAHQYQPARSTPRAYFARIAAIGSRRAARRAGPSAATSVTADSRTATPASGNGSPAPTSSISEAIARVASQAPAPPTTVPNADWLQGFDDDAAPNACGPLAQRHANLELPWLLADLDQDFDALAARDIRAAHRWPRPTRSHARRTVASASSSSSRRRHQWQAFGHSRERRHRVCERAMAEFRERRDGQGLFVVQVDRNASPSRTTDARRWVCAARNPHESVREWMTICPGAAAGMSFQPVRSTLIRWIRCAPYNVLSSFPWCAPASRPHRPGFVPRRADAPRAWCHFRFRAIRTRRRQPRARLRRRR